MSYSRWSDSSWYCFSNVNGRLSLWFDMESTHDLDYSMCQEATPEMIKEVYGCSETEANEAMRYIGYYLAEHTEAECAALVEDHNKVVVELMEKLDEQASKD